MTNGRRAFGSMASNPRQPDTAMVTRAVVFGARSSRGHAQRSALSVEISIKLRYDGLLPIRPFINSLLAVVPRQLLCKKGNQRKESFKCQDAKMEPTLYCASSNTDASCERKPRHYSRLPEERSMKGPHSSRLHATPYLAFFFV